MAEQPTPLPEIDVDAADERPMLEAFLRYFRAVLGRKADGLTDDEARLAACPPSDMSILGLVRHMADVERFWAKRVFRGDDDVPLFYGDAHPEGDDDGDFHPPAGATLQDAVAAYWREIADADVIYAAAGLDELVAHERRGERNSLRWIYVHMIEEYARHCGHADLIREAIDGATGD